MFLTFSDPLESSRGIANNTKSRIWLSKIRKTGSKKYGSKYQCSGFSIKKLYMVSMKTIEYT